MDECDDPREAENDLCKSLSLGCKKLAIVGPAIIATLTAEEASDVPSRKEDVGDASREAM